MAFCEWDDSYSIKVPEADEQHQRLFDLINQLHEGMTDNDGRATTEAAVDEMGTIAAVLDELIRYTSYHFSTEEKYMLDRAYPAYASHKAAHGHFIERVRTFKRDYEEGRSLRSIEIIQFLKDWLENHIRTMDREFGTFVNKEGQTKGCVSTRAPASKTTNVL